MPHVMGIWWTQLAVTLKKRWRATAVQDAERFPTGLIRRDSVPDCASPLALCIG